MFNLSDVKIFSDVELLGEDVDKSCEVEIPVDILELSCDVETLVEVRSSSDSESIGYQKNLDLEIDGSSFLKIDGSFVPSPAVEVWAVLVDLVRGF